MCIVLLPNSSSLTMNTTNIWSGNLVLMWNNLRFLDINSRLLLVIKNMWHSSRVPSPAIVSRGLHDSLAVQPGLPNDVGRMHEALQGDITWGHHNSAALSPNSIKMLEIYGWGSQRIWGFKSTECTLVSKSCLCINISLPKKHPEKNNKHNF